MKKTIVLCVFGLAVAAILFYLLHGQQAGGPRQSTEKGPSVINKAGPTLAPEVSPSQGAAPQAQPELSARALKADPSRSNELMQAVEQARAKAIKLHPGQVLASVNGISITLRDLIAIDPSESTDTEHSMSENSYQYLLDRAINRELALQAAQQQGVRLNQEQEAQLDQIERSIRGRDGANPENVVAHLNTSASLDNQIEFEKRDAAGLLMQEALLAHSGGPPPHITEDQVQQYYQQNIQRYGPLPAAPEERDAAWRQINAQIRTDLRYTVLQAHQDGLNDYMNRLKADASIQISDVKDKSPSTAGK